MLTSAPLPPSLQAEPSRKILDVASTAAEVASDASQVASDASKVAGDVSQAIKGIFWDATSELGGCLKGLPCGAPGALGCCDGYCCQDAFCVPC